MSIRPAHACTQRQLARWRSREVTTRGTRPGRLGRCGVTVKGPGPRHARRTPWAGSPASCSGKNWCGKASKMPGSVFAHFLVCDTICTTTCCTFGENEIKSKKWLPRSPFFATFLAHALRRRCACAAAFTTGIIRCFLAGWTLQPNGRAVDRRSAGVVLANGRQRPWTQIR